MSNLITTTVRTVQDLCSEGMTADVRETRTGFAKLIQGFDIFTRPHSLTPYVSQTQADGSATDNMIVDMLKYTVSGTSYVYGRGVVHSTGKAEIYRKSDYTSSVWSTYANNSASTGGAVNGIFVEYKGFGYGGNSDGTIWKADLTAGTGWNDDIHTTSNSLALTSNGIVHSKDDILYFGANNLLISNNAGSWADPALTLPARYSIVTLCEYGNYLAIGCKSVVSGGRSIVYLWDRDSTLTTLAESIDWGTGNLQILEQVEGELIGVSIVTEQVPSGYTPARIVFRRYSGGVADVFREIVGSSTSGAQVVYGKKQGQRLYILAGITIDGTFYTGIWGVAKNDAGRWIVWFDRTPNGDTAIQTSNPLQGFYIEGDYLIVSYFDSTSKLTQTSNSSSYTGSSIIETVINPNMPAEHYYKNKSLLALAVNYDSLPAAGQVVIKWSVDGGAFQTARTEVADGVTCSEISATEATFIPGREYRFRIESTGGAIIAGIEYKYEILRTLIEP